MKLRKEINQFLFCVYYASVTELEISIFVIISIHHKYPETDFIFVFIL